MKSILLSLLLFVALFSGAQTYHPLVDSTKLWTTLHIFYPCSPPVCDYIRFSGDTVFDNQTWYHVWHYTNEAMTQRYLEGFVREDLTERKVYERYTDVAQEFLLYDFGVQAGDTVNFLLNPYPYLVDSVGSVALMNGDQRRAVYLHIDYPYFCQEKWVEGIGSVSRGVMNSGFCGTVGDDPRMLCAWDSNVMTYHTPDYTYCFLTTGVADKDHAAFLKVQPNPASTLITVSLEDPALLPLSFELTDMRGQVILRDELRSRQVAIPLDKRQVPAGMYLWRAVSGKGSAASGRLTVL